jgi:predicted O-methyltransferase YrrM
MLRTAFLFLRHWLTARTAYGAHSPFVYSFVRNVLPARRMAVGNQLEALRRRLLRDDRVLEIEDFGAGYGGHQQPLVRKRVSQVARSSARSRREGELLFRICHQFQPQSCLELGTNLGVSTLYQALALTHSRFTTIEGSGALADLASRHFAEFGASPRLLQGDFMQVLHGQLDSERFDYVFLDGNHRLEPTLEYVDWLLPRMNRDSILILDDINWSEGMRQAWAAVKARPEVSVSVDLFFLGICFVKRNQAKEDFRFRL